MSLRMKLTLDDIKVIDTVLAKAADDGRLTTEHRAACSAVKAKLGPQYAMFNRAWIHVVNWYANNKAGQPVPELVYLLIPTMDDDA